jgi:hypothetical protein
MNYLPERMASKAGRLAHHSSAILQISWETSYLEYGYCRSFQKLYNVSRQFVNWGWIITVNRHRSDGGKLSWRTPNHDESH